MKRLLRGVLWGVLLGTQSLCFGQTTSGQLPRILYPRAESGSPAFINFYWGLLREACRRTEAEYGPVHIVETGGLMNHLRAMDELAMGSLDVYVRAYIPKKYQDSLDLVPFPLDKGLIGHRIPLIHRKTQTALYQVQTLDALRMLRIGQGATWLDADILESAGMKVIRSTSYQGLFPMLSNGQIDLFPRGANEVRGEYLARSALEPDLVIDKALLLAYQMSFYFIVRKDESGQKLKQRLTLGLQRMRSDGSFEKAYRALKAEVLKDIDLRNRQLIQIPHAFYSQADYRAREPEFWDDLRVERGLPPTRSP